MTETKQIVTGRVVRIDGNKIYVRNGDTVDVYNSDYYRIIVEGGETGAN